MEGHLHACLGVSVLVCVAMHLCDIVLCMFPGVWRAPARVNACLSCSQAWVVSASGRRVPSVCVCAPGVLSVPLPSPPHGPVSP